MKIYVACDHSGFDLKEKIITNYSQKFQIFDFGTNSKESCNYNEIAQKMILKLQEDSIKDQISEITNFGILICGSGTGMSIFANRFIGIRACNAINEEQIRLARSHNNSNVICFGEKFISIESAIKMIDIFTGEKFEGGRHINRLVFDSKKCINLNYRGVIGQNYNEIKSKLKYFLCGEFEFSIEEDISGQEVTIFQSFEAGKFNDDLMKFQIVCDVLKRNNVKKIIYFAPFLPYTRQDKTYETKVSLGSKIVAEIINNCGVSEVITYDLHALQIEGFFKCKMQNLSMIPTFIEDIKQKFNSNETVIIFPDAGSASRFKRFFVEENFEIAIINKHRTESGIKMNILGNVRNKNTIILDDMIDSGGTLIEATKILLNNKAMEISVYATHGIFSNNGIEKLNNSIIKKIIVSNSVYYGGNCGKIETIELADSKS